MSKVYIVSNFDYDPSEVISSLNADYILCNQGDDSKIPEKLKELKNYRQTKHTGHNISDYLQYIIENYHDLPDEIGFIKGNIFPRHIEKDIFLSRIKESGFIPLYSDDSTYNEQYHGFFVKKFTAQQIAPGIYLETANEWYLEAKQKGKYFPTLESLFIRLFNRKPPQYITFTPGACMIVSKDKILRWSKELYQELYKIVSYDFFPVEAYHVERCMLYIFEYHKN